MGKKKLIGLLLAVVLLYGLGSSMYHHNILDSVNRNFQISLPGFYQKYIYGVSAREGEREEGYNAFACRDADAVHYSVWRFFRPGSIAASVELAAKRSNPAGRDRSGAADCLCG